MARAVYPGSFDPVHNGHVDVIQRAAKIFDDVTVAVLGNPLKSGSAFDVDARVDLLTEVTADVPGVTVDRFDGLLADYMRKARASVIVKGLRAISDFEYELQMAHLNRQLNPEVETTFIMTATRWSYVSSTRIKELARYGADVSAWVPAPTRARLEAWAATDPFHHDPHGRLRR